MARTKPFHDPSEFGRIYLITNISNGKKYVGQTVKPIAERWLKYCAKARCAASRGMSHPVSDETRRKIGAKHKGKVMSAEARAKISAAQLGKKRGPRPKWVIEKIIATKRLKREVAVSNG